MLTEDPEPIDYLVRGVVARGTLTLLLGREKQGKTLVTMAFAARGVAGGGTLAGIEVAPLRVLIVDAENGYRELHRRVRLLGLQAAHAERIEICEAVGHDLRHHIGELAGLLTEVRPDLVVLDSVEVAVGRRRERQRRGRALPSTRSATSSGSTTSAPC